MIKLLKRAVVLLVLCAVTGVNVSAKTVIRKVTFKRDVTVGGTVVKAGTYKVVFDDETGELSIIKGDKAVAKAPAQLEKIEGRAAASYGDYIVRGDSTLSSVTLKNGNLAVVGSSGDSAGREQ